MNYNIPLQLIDLHGDGFHLLVEAIIFGTTFKLVLDTGASKTAFDQTMLLQANDQATLNSTDRLSTGLGTSNMVSYTANLSNLQLGDLIIPELEVAVLDLSTINQAYAVLDHPQVLGVLGGDILLKYNAVIDYKRLTLNLTIED